MKKHLLIGFIVLSVVILISGCIRPKEPVPQGGVPDTENWEIYQNEEYGFSLKYPSTWEIESEAYHFIILAPSKEKSWQPNTPSDIPKDPKIRIDFGEYIRERLGPKNFPETISPAVLEDWLEAKVSNGEARDFTKRTINNFQAFEITEIYVPGCVKAIYWRPANLDSLIRVQTGCESQYLDEFNWIVNSIQLIKSE